MKVNLLDDRTDWWLWLDVEAIALGLVDSGSDVNNPMEGFLSRVIGVLDWENNELTRYRKNDHFPMFYCYDSYFHQITVNC